MKDAGLTAGCAHKPPVLFKPKARPCDGNQQESIKMKEHGGGGGEATVGRQTQPEERERLPTWKAAQKRKKDRTEQNQNPLCF